MDTGESSTKRCSKCREYKPPSSFNRDKSQPTGLSYRCKVCDRAKARKYREENPEAVEATLRRYREANRELLASKRREYCSANPEKVAASFKSYYYANRERMGQRYREYVLGNREKIRSRDRHRRAAVRGAEGEHTAEEVLQMCGDQGWLCAYCESPLEDVPHVDHMIPLSRSGRNDWTNLAIACSSCNLRKGAKTAEEFMEGRKRLSESAAM